MQGSSYKIAICPVCREQVHEEFGFEAEPFGHYHDEYRGLVKPVELEVEWDEIELRFDLGRSSLDLELDEQRAQQIRWDAQVDWWKSLPKEERERRHQEKLDAMGPWERAMHSMFMEQRGGLLHDITRQAYGWKGGFTTIPGDDDA